jgi:hypothetical protein
MKTTKNLTLVAVFVVALAALVPAQDQPKPAEPEKQPGFVPLRVDVIFSEFLGSKKISSLPYTLLVNANEHSKTRLRMGLRVPFATGAKGPGTPNSSTQDQYQDIGTNIDCSAESIEGGRFSLFVSVERLLVYNPDEKQQTGEVPYLSPHPIFGQFKFEISGLLMRDGETVQSAMATDPVGGQVLKLDVTLHVVK